MRILFSCKSSFSIELPPCCLVLRPLRLLLRRRRAQVGAQRGLDQVHHGRLLARIVGVAFHDDSDGPVDLRVLLRHLEIVRQSFFVSRF